MPFAPSNYLQIWHAAPVLQWTFNSLYLGVLSAVTVTFSSALVAFAFAYFRFPGRNFLFGCVHQLLRRIRPDPLQHHRVELHAPAEPAPDPVQEPLRYARPATYGGTGQFGGSGLSEIREPAPTLASTAWPLYAGANSSAADGNGAVLVRTQEGSKQYSLRLKDLLKRGDISANAMMMPGDIIIVPQSWF